MTTTIDLAALELIASRAIPRAHLQDEGYRSVLGSSDLFRHGYFVRHWYHIEREKEVLEYNPRHSRLPRLTATCYMEQVEIHRVLGLNLVPPGEQWEDYGGRGLFDELWVSEEGQ